MDEKLDGRSSRARYPFRTMDVNDFFYVVLSNDVAEADKLKNTARAASIQFGKRHGLKFKTKTVLVDDRTPQEIADGAPVKDVLKLEVKRTA